ncbi:MAG: STAS domain-containing protein [Atopobiaceae bacterium]|nr:STAS domain-containing protein [Atopobiaceae bacterium]
MNTFGKTVEGTVLTLAPHGIVDATNAPQLQDEISKSLEGMTTVVFDFDSLEYISSAGLRVLLATQKALGKPGAVHVRNVPADVMEVLTVTKLAQFMTVE